MKKSFTITRAEIEAGDAAALLSEIVKGTGSESEAASVLRGIERMGMDAKIESFEIIPVAGRRMNGGPATNSWRVRADRGVAPEAQP